MNREIIAEVFPWQSRTAILEDGKLSEVFRTGNESDVGTIYKGKIQKVLPGILCAFVDIGREKNAILYFSDVVNGKDAPQLYLKKGQDILVQMVKEETGDKGARITEEITLPGRLLVLMPFREELRVSRKIEGNEARGRLKTLMRQLLPAGMGVILRTACQHASVQELEAEMQQLLARWREIEKQADSGKVPSVVCREADELERALREYLDGDTHTIRVNDALLYEKLRAFTLTLQKETRPKVILQEGALFQACGLHQQMQQAVSRKVWLKSGGFLIFDQTEAMMVVDVNSGKFTGKDDFEETVSRVNLEAAREIPRQLRLRGIGGIILIDFIDMQSPEDQEKVLQALRQELQKDKEHTKVLGFTGLGLLEMTRKKTRKASLEQFTAECSICGGAGRVISLSSCAVNLKNELVSSAYLEGKTIICRLHPDLAEEMRKDPQTLTWLQQQMQKTICLEEDRQRRWADYQIVSE